jgi:hypothetical protein
MSFLTVHPHDCRLRLEIGPIQRLEFRFANLLSLFVFILLTLSFTLLFISFVFILLTLSFIVLLNSSMLLFL